MRLLAALRGSLGGALGGGSRRAWKGAKPKLLGLSFLAVVVGLVGLSISFYNKAFTNVTMVTLETDRIGNSLGQNADVKIRGLLVGEVRAVRSTGEHAVMTIALQPGQTRLIPVNVLARIAPKTLFGEKFVDLVVPKDQPAGVRAIRAGDVIPQDRSRTAIELGQVFDDLVPLLQTVQPAKLDSTLTSIATALQGRGDALGDNLVRVHDYFRQLNPALPDLNADISKLADLADNLDAAAPDLFRMLTVSSAVSDNVVREQGQLRSFLTKTRGFTDTAARVLQRNEGDLIRVGKVGRPVLETVRDNGQQLPYIFQGLTELTPRINDALGGQGPFLHINAQVVKDRGPYVRQQDCPNYANRDAVGPNCPDYKPGSTNGATTVDFADPAGSAAEQAQIASVVGPAVGMVPGDVPGLADVLFGPVLRGTQVSLS